MKVLDIWQGTVGIGELWNKEEGLNMGTIAIIGII